MAPLLVEAYRMDESSTLMTFAGPVCGLLCCLFVALVLVGAVVVFLRKKKSPVDEAPAAVDEAPRALQADPLPASAAPAGAPPPPLPAGGPPPMPVAAPGGPPPMPRTAPARTGPPPVPDATMLPPPDADPGFGEAPTTPAGPPSGFARSVNLSALNKPLAAGATIVPDDDWIDQQDGDETVLLPRNGKKG
jgi:hypothetical protein